MTAKDGMVLCRVRARAQYRGRNDKGEMQHFTAGEYVNAPISHVKMFAHSLEVIAGSQAPEVEVAKPPVEVAKPPVKSGTDAAGAKTSSTAK